MINSLNKKALKDLLCENICAVLNTVFRGCPRQVLGQESGEEHDIPLVMGRKQNGTC